MLWRIIFKANGKLPNCPLNAALVDILFTPNITLQHFICRGSAGALSQTVLKLVSFRSWDIYAAQTSLPYVKIGTVREVDLLIYTGL